MSYVDLATLAIHRRQEMEARLNVFLEKCDRSILGMRNLKVQAQSFINHLNCEPAQLKDRFLSCMKQLDEYTYLVTDFNMALEKLDLISRVEYPVQDVSNEPLKPVPLMPALNLIDALSEPIPSTSRACSNQCPSEKPHKTKIPKEDQLLIMFSSTSCSSESVPVARSERDVQCQLTEKVESLALNDSQPTIEEVNLPAQEILQVDHVYPATIMHVEGLSFWIITHDIDDAYQFMIDMTDYYKKNMVELSLDELMSLTYCAYYDDESDCYYRGYYIKLSEDDMSIVEVYSVDTGETHCVSTSTIQPLAPKFCTLPPFARSCYLAGVDPGSNQNKELLERQELFLKDFRGQHCDVKIDDNSSESLGVYVVLTTGEIVNELFVKEGLGLKNDRLNTSLEVATPPSRGLPELDAENFDITEGPEFDDPVEAVTGYRNRDEIDICKHYKGGPDKKCFKGARCTKRHVKKHPDGWTLDRVSVPAKCIPRPLPAPDTWHRVFVTHVAHFDHFYAHFNPEEKTVIETLPDFGVVLPPNNLEKLVVDMNSPASRMAYKPLKMVPAPGELVAALYPPDQQWYRGRVISSTRADQNVEVMYIDYGNVVWVKEDAIRELSARYWALPAQAMRCALAGVAPRSDSSKQWALAREALRSMILEKTLQAHIIARDYDEVTVEIFDDQGNSVAEQLAAQQHVQLKEYAVLNDAKVKQRVVVP